MIDPAGSQPTAPAGLITLAGAPGAACVGDACLPDVSDSSAGLIDPAGPRGTASVKDAHHPREPALPD